MKLKIYKTKNLDIIGKQKVDNFILNNETNGEFINTLKYLDYHPENRFIDKSIVIIDINSGNIMCVFMAAVNYSNDKVVISHPGTTFSGPVFNRETKISDISTYINMIDSYYKTNHEEIIIKLTSPYYSFQPNEEVNFILLRNGFSYGYTALSNIIDLTNIKSEEDVFNLYYSKRRNQVKKSIRNIDYKFKQTEKIDEKIWEDMNEHLAEKYNTKTTHSYQEICEIKNKFPNNVFIYQVNDNNNEYAAFGLIYKFKNIIHTQYLSVNNKSKVQYANLILVHYLIKEAICDKVKFFSFGSSTENEGRHLNENLYKYKIQYGGGNILMPKFTKKF